MFCVDKQKHILRSLLVLRINKFVSSGYEFPSRIFFVFQHKEITRAVDGTCSEALSLIAIIGTMLSPRQDIIYQ
jgi:hypothetical protein